MNNPALEFVTTLELAEEISRRKSRCFILYPDDKDKEFILIQQDIDQSDLESVCGWVEAEDEDEMGDEG